MALVLVLENEVLQAAVAARRDLPLPGQLEQIVCLAADDVACAACVLAVFRRKHEHAVGDRPARAGGVRLLVETPARPATCRRTARRPRRRRAAAAPAAPGRHVRSRRGRRRLRPDRLGFGSASRHLSPQAVIRQANRPRAPVWFPRPKSSCVNLADHSKPNLIAQRSGVEYVLLSYWIEGFRAIRHSHGTETRLTGTGRQSRARPSSRKAPPAGRQDLAGRLRPLQAEMRRRLTRADVLTEMIRAVNASLEPERVADAMVARVSAWIPVPGWLVLASTEDGEIRPAGIPRHPVDARGGGPGRRRARGAFDDAILFGGHRGRQPSGEGRTPASSCGGDRFPAGVPWPDRRGADRHRPGAVGPGTEARGRHPVRASRRHWNPEPLRSITRCGCSGRRRCRSPTT